VSKPARSNSLRNRFGEPTVLTITEQNFRSCDVVDFKGTKRDVDMAVSAFLSERRGVVLRNLKGDGQREVRIEIPKRGAV
jgi:hypothetical protein